MMSARVFIAHQYGTLAKSGVTKNGGMPLAPTLLVCWNPHPERGDNMKTGFAVAVAFTLLIGAAIAAFSSRGTAIAQAETVKHDVQSKTVTYKDGETECEGFIAWDAGRKGIRPVVLVVHDWMGRGEFDEARAKQLAELGYLAFSADVYGKGVRPKNAEQAGDAAGSWKADVPALRTRLKAALDTALADASADKTRVAILGYCFGGTCALELARSGADIDGAISFHGGLDSETPDDAKAIKGKVLVLHGADDPFADLESVLALNEEMKNAGVDYQVVLYGHAVHSFTNRRAGTDNSKGAAYNEKADRRSWEAMQDFLADALK
jgi:dienelactone hydrolase